MEHTHDHRHPHTHEAVQAVQLPLPRSPQHDPPLNGLGKQIINEHITHCIAHAIEEGDTDSIEEFQKAIRKFL